MFIAKLVTRILYGFFYLRAHVLPGVDNQLFGGKRHLHLTDARHLAHGGFHFACAGSAVHPGYLPRIAEALRLFIEFRGWLAGIIAAAAPGLRRERAQLHGGKLRGFFIRWAGRHDILRE